MAERPILFNPSMVRAILEGRKTQTRRLIKNAPVLYEVRDPDRITFGTWLGRYTARFTWNGIAIGGFDLPSPYEPGDILYVRETFGVSTFDNGEYSKSQFVYKADMDPKYDNQKTSFWRPSIHMPKEAARIFLRVTDVKANRLTEMTEKDAKAEGARVATNMSGIMYRFDFIKIWESTLKPADFDKYKWNANPWVWVIEFEVAEIKENSGE